MAVKFVVSDTLNQNSVTLRESVLSQLLSHPNVVQTYTTRVAVMDDASLQRIHGQGDGTNRNNIDSMRFVSGACALFGWPDNAARRQGWAVGALGACATR